MSENSTTIVQNMKELISKFHDKNILVTFGFVREIDLKEIPVEIITYCVIYAFLSINEWFMAGPQWIIDDNKYIAYGCDNYKYDKYGTFSTVYANPVISNGKHEWKIKITSTDPKVGFHVSSNCYIGISENKYSLDYGTFMHKWEKYYAFYQFDEKSSPTMSGEQDYPLGVDYYSRWDWKDGDIMTVHLDMEQRTIGFSLNKTFLGIAFDDIEDGDYRLAICMYGRKNKQFEFIQ